MCYYLTLMPDYISIKYKITNKTPYIIIKYGSEKIGSTKMDECFLMRMVCVIL